MTSTVVYLLLAFSNLAVTVLGHQYTGYNFGIDVNARLARRRLETNQPFVLNRLASSQDGPGDLPLRREIRDLEKDTDQWTLYILGLSMMQYTNQSDAISWYQITGIHGVPFQTWGGVEPTPGNENTGYCTHISVLFPTWHRPYLSMYENILYSMMSDIANLWPEDQDKQRYQRATTNFRIPYWDWTVNQTSNGTLLPYSIGGNETITVDGPEGVQTISNPLFMYQFKPLNKSDFLSLPPWDVWTTTVRAPTSNQSSADSNNSVVETQLEQSVNSMRSRLHTLLTNYKNYTTFSNSAWIPDGANSSYDSLEALHDVVHSITGGGTGHMAYIPFSAFDPIFFLHHANVDRLFAIWQGLYPNSWVEPAPAATASYTTSIGDIQDAKTNLTPFFATADGGFYNSDMVRDPKWLGYSYAEVANLSLGVGALPNKTLQSQLKREVNRQFGSSTVPQIVSRLREKLAWGPETHSRVNSLMSDGRYYEWIANVHVNKQALRGPFDIHLYLGEVPTDSTSWTPAPTIAGRMGVFAAPEMPGIPMMNHNISGTIPLTTSLTDKVISGHLSSLDPSAVVPFLKQHLTASVVRNDGTCFDPDRIPSLGIHIVSSSVLAPTSDDEFPEWSSFTSHFDLV